jgi:hypothetical protein
VSAVDKKEVKNPQKITFKPFLLRTCFRLKAKSCFIFVHFLNFEVGLQFLDQKINFSINVF